MRNYQVRRVNIGKTTQLDELAHECGLLYSQTVVFFWRTVQHKGIWLKAKHLMRLFTSPQLHAHTADACVQAFFASLTSWRERKKLEDTDAHPPRRRKWYFRVEYKRSAMNLKNGQLRLSNGKVNDPLVLEWPWELPQTVVIHWTGIQYEAIATYRMEETGARPMGGEIAGIDLGEVHIAVSHHGTSTHILNGRLLRATLQYQNKLKEHLSKKIERLQAAQATHPFEAETVKQTQESDQGHRTPADFTARFHTVPRGCANRGHWRCARYPTRQRCGLPQQSEDSPVVAWRSPPPTHLQS